MPQLRIVQETPQNIGAYGAIPMALTVHRIYRVHVLGNRFRLAEERVETPWLKDYEEREEDRPINLAKRYDLSRWGIFAAYIAERRVGGAMVAPSPDAWFTTKGAALADIRVDSAARRMGVGAGLIQACIEWARERALSELVIETQNINVGACRLYESQGAVLAEAHPGAYPEHPEEIRLIWKIDLEQIRA